MAQGVIGPDGLGMSGTMDMGGSDCPARTGEASSFITESVSLALHRLLSKLTLISDNPNIQAMWKARSKRFGLTSRNARILFAMMYRWAPPL